MGLGSKHEETIHEIQHSASSSRMRRQHEKKKKKRTGTLVRSPGQDLPHTDLDNGDLKATALCSHLRKQIRGMTKIQTKNYADETTNM